MLYVWMTVDCIASRLDGVRRSAFVAIAAPLGIIAVPFRAFLGTLMLWGFTWGPTSPA
jgi:hypothetical protein